VKKKAIKGLNRFKITINLILVTGICMFSVFIFPKISHAEFLQTFLYRCGGKGFIAGDEVTLAKFDVIIGLNRFRYDNINGNTWAAIKAINPNIELYLYQLGKSAEYDDDSKLALSLNNIARYDRDRGHSMGNLNTDNSDLYLLDASSNRITNNSYPNGYFMDFGSSRFQNYWLEATITDIVRQDWKADGIYLDVTSAIQAKASSTPVKYNTAVKWSVAMNNFCSAITVGLHAVNQKAIFNRGQTRYTDGYNAWVALDSETHPPDGVLEEGAFVVNWGPSDAQFYPENDWKRQIDLMAQIHNSKLLYQSHSDLDEGDSGIDQDGNSVTFWDVLWYAMGSFHIGKNTVDNNSYFGFTESYNKQSWYDEYDYINLGRAMDNYKVTNYGGKNIYWREFEKGYVFVNPTKREVSSIALPKTCKQLNHSNFKNNPDTLPNINTISLKAYRAAILLKKTIDSIEDSQLQPPQGLTISN